MSSGRRKGPVSGRQHLLNLVVSAVAALVTLGGTGSFVWAIVVFLVTGILLHTLFLNARLGQR